MFLDRNNGERMFCRQSHKKVIGTVKKKKLAVRKWQAVQIIGPQMH